MSKITKEFLTRNSKNRLAIHCMGDAMIDEYYSVKVNRISPEFPMSIMHSFNDAPTSRPGGVANVAYQLKHFNVDSTLICFPCRKAEGIFSEYGLNQMGDFPKITAKLPIKRRFLDGGVQVVRHDIEIPLCGLKEGDIEDYHWDLEEAIQFSEMKPNVVIFSDYDKGFFHDTLNAPSLYPRATKTIVDPKNGSLGRWRGCTVFKPNTKEAEELSGKKTWQEQAKKLQSELDCEAVVITHGGDRVSGIWKNELFLYEPTKKVNVNSVVGAGDCFCAFFAMAMGHNFTIPEAVEIAYTAGSMYVQHRMNKPVAPAELIEHGMVEPEHLVNRDFKLVFTNGCFDLLHKGHIETLKFAKSKGDKLVVALNSDASIKRLKGDTRPIVPLEHRMMVLANLEMVDFVVSFDEDTPREIIEIIKPDVLVKGSEYHPSKIVGADLVNEVYTAPMIQGVSTSIILANG